MKGLSLFASSGIGETYLSRIGVDIKVANELIEKRAALYRKLHPDCNMICGDISDKTIFNQIIENSQGIEFLLASPPCQGMSVAGKNRHQDAMIEDNRNYLINYVFQTIDLLKPKFVMIENVPALLKFQLPYEGKYSSILDILKSKFGKDYKIEGKIVDASDYGVPQTRLRAIIKMYPYNNYSWPWPEVVARKITVRDAIGDLPSLEAGENSNIKWHFARKHDKRHIEWMKHTATGTSAFSNEVFYPMHFSKWSVPYFLWFCPLCYTQFLPQFALQWHSEIYSVPLRKSHG